MRKLIFAINIALDGCCDHTKFFPDEDTMGYFTNLTRSADTFLYGRETYQLMVPYWPDVAKKNPGEGDREVDIEFAKAFEEVDRIVVVSRTLENPGSEKATVIRKDIQNEILKLKQKPGKNILTGGINLPSQLAGLGLIDEYRLIVHPIVAGEGRRLLDGADLQGKLQIKLAEQTVLKSGRIVLRYVKE